MIPYVRQIQKCKRLSRTKRIGVLGRLSNRINRDTWYRRGEPGGAGASQAGGTEGGGGGGGGVAAAGGVAAGLVGEVGSPRNECVIIENRGGMLRMSSDRRPATPSGHLNNHDDEDTDDRESPHESRRLMAISASLSESDIETSCL